LTFQAKSCRIAINLFLALPRKKFIHTACQAANGRAILPLCNAHPPRPTLPEASLPKRSAKRRAPSGAATAKRACLTKKDLFLQKPSAKKVAVANGRALQGSLDSANKWQEANTTLKQLVKVT
jgi:hypothetical protein